MKERERRDNSRERVEKQKAGQIHVECNYRGRLE